MQEIVELNAIIKSTMIGYQSGVITAWVNVEHELGSQGFGGYALKTLHENRGFLGFFVKNVLDIVGVRDWNDLINKPIRVRCNNSKIVAIGHFIKDSWFYPEIIAKIIKEEQAMKEQNSGLSQ